MTALTWDATRSPGSFVHQTYGRNSASSPCPTRCAARALENMRLARPEADRTT